MLSQLSLFDGKVCTKCREWKPYANYDIAPRMKDGRSSNCKACHLLANRERWHKNHEFSIERQRERRKDPAVAQQNRDCSARYYWQNKERRQAYQKANLDKCRARVKKYRLLHLEKWKMRSKIWAQTHRAHRCASEQKRRAIKNSCMGAYTAHEWNSIKAKYNFTCLCCGRREPEIKLTFDHVIPLSKGGGNSIENCQPLCRSCNSAKGAKNTDYRE